MSFSNASLKKTAPAAQATRANLSSSPTTARLGCEVVANVAAVNKQAKRYAFAPLDQPDLFGTPSPVQGEGYPVLIIPAAEIGRTCRTCKGESFLSTPPKGPHSLGIKCSQCGAHNGWLPHDEAQRLLREARS